MVTKYKNNQTKYKGKLIKFKKSGIVFDLCCWMKLVAPSSSTYTREWGGSTNGQSRVARRDSEQKNNATIMGV
jgi:hypothetical protein